MRKWFNNPKYRRQILTAPDGGTIALDWFRGCDKKKRRIPLDAPIVILVHALCGKRSTQILVGSVEGQYEASRFALRHGTTKLREMS